MERLVQKEDSPTIIELGTSAGMTHMPYFNVFENALKISAPVEGKLRNMSVLSGRARYCADEDETTLESNGTGAS